MVAVRFAVHGDASQAAKLSPIKQHSARISELLAGMSVKTFVAAKFSAAIPTADRPSALAAFADSSAAPPTPSASGAAPPSPPERMAAGSDSSEARHGRISPCAANPGASVRNGDKCSASPDPTGEREPYERGMSLTTRITPSRVCERV
ncbi:hypothetical protein T484DRAFT_1920248 [Baffinella frigidus]|nr:hypothetical protein T484DRAFT_1920248 [Cryptophyta sp. CCMP2293]